MFSMVYSGDLVQPSRDAIKMVHDNHAFFNGNLAYDKNLLSAPFSQPERAARHPDCVWAEPEPTSNGLKQVGRQYTLNDKPSQTPFAYETVGYFNPKIGQHLLHIRVIDRDTGVMVRRL